MPKDDDHILMRCKIDEVFEHYGAIRILQEGKHYTTVQNGRCVLSVDDGTACEDYWAVRSRGIGPTPSRGRGYAIQSSEHCGTPVRSIYSPSSTQWRTAMTPSNSPVQPHWQRTLKRWASVGSRLLCELEHTDAR